MFPLLKEGTLSIVQKTNKIRLFDVCAFKTSHFKNFILHRAVKIYDDKVIFHGDNSASFFKCKAGFELVPKNNVKGRIIGIIRKEKKIEGVKFMVLSFLSLVYGGVKVTPFLMKTYFDKFLTKKE
jgi:predicted glycosyltransferase